MDSIKQLSVLLLCIASVLADAQAAPPVLPDPSKIPIYQARIPGEATLYESAEFVDEVIHVVIHRATSNRSNDAFEEAFSIIDVRGSVATPNGVEPLPRSYKIRATSAWSAEYSNQVNGSEWILFIKNNRSDHSPIQRAHRVRDGIVYDHRNPTKAIISITEQGHIHTGSQYNTCEKTEYLEFYNPKEDLDLVIQFTCADGSQWVTGNDAPADYVERAITPEKFMAAVANYLDESNLPAPDLARGVEPVNRSLSLRPENQLTEWTKYRDDMFRYTMETLTEEQWAAINTTPPEKNKDLQQFVKRELARGKRPNDLPAKARTVLPFVSSGSD